MLLGNHAILSGGETIAGALSPLFFCPMPVLVYPDGRRQRTSALVRKAQAPGGICLYEVKRTSFHVEKRHPAAFCVIPLSQQLGSLQALQPVEMAWALFVFLPLLPMALSPPPGPNLQTPTFLAPVFLLQGLLLAFACPVQTHPKKTFSFCSCSSFTWAKSHKSCRAEHGGGGGETNRLVLSSHGHPPSRLPVHSK